MRRSERLWHLAYKYGMGESFTGMWVEGLETTEVARRISADTAAKEKCRWADLLKGVNIGSGVGVAWVGRLNDNWTQILQRGVESLDVLPALSAGNRRALLVSWNVNAVGDLVYAIDGNYATAFSVTRPGRRRGSDPHALDLYAEGLQFDAQDSSWENDPDLPAGWMEYSAWEEARLEGDIPEDDYEDMRPEWMDLLEFAVNGYSPPLATCITSALALVGRITGRELDEAWMNGVHTRFLITRR
ncbi:DUF6461 domain-containing protein [Nonomuraea sp. NPDC049750]|uniref:DUF6461 domain-containing protein n=1 Tax=Nonomuraea sp. NPDC049750 TaxID=3154738 RepID=UPI0033FBF609